MHQMRAPRPGLGALLVTLLPIGSNLDQHHQAILELKLRGKGIRLFAMATAPEVCV